MASLSNRSRPHRTYEYTSTPGSSSSSVHPSSPADSANASDHSTLSPLQVQAKENVLVRGIEIAGWRVESSKGSIGNSREIDGLSDLLKLPPPEMTFPKTNLTITHLRSGFAYKFDALGALLDVEGVPVHSGGRARSRMEGGSSAIKVSYAKEWGKSRELTSIGASASSPSTGSSNAAGVTRTSPVQPGPNAVSTSAFSPTAPPSSRFGPQVVNNVATVSSPKPYDWTYTTTHPGAIVTPPPPPPQQGSSDPFEDSSEGRPAPVKIPSQTFEFVLSASHTIPLDQLSKPEPILFYDDLMLFEDELADNGSSVISVKVRVMPSSFFILQRFFLRVDNVLFRVFDTRIYCPFSSIASGDVSQDERIELIRERSGWEAPYEKVKMRLPPYKPHDLSPLTDSGWVANALQAIAAKEARERERRRKLDEASERAAPEKARVDSGAEEAGDDKWEGIGTRVEVLVLGARVDEDAWTDAWRVSANLFRRRIRGLAFASPLPSNVLQSRFPEMPSGVRFQTASPSTERHRSTPEAEPGAPFSQQESEEDGPDDDDDNIVGDARIVLSFMVKLSKLGCAAYDAATSKLYLMEDQFDNPVAGIEGHGPSASPDPDEENEAADNSEHGRGGDLIALRELRKGSEEIKRIYLPRRTSLNKATPHSIVTVINQFSPDLVLTSSQCVGAQRIIKREMIKIGGSFQIRPGREFTTTSGRTRLHQLHLPTFFSSYPGSTSETDVEDTRSHASTTFTGRASSRVSSSRDHDQDDQKIRRTALQVASLVDLDKAPLSVMAAGGLLTHLNRVVAIRAIPGDEPTIAIQSIEMISMSEIMQVNSDAMVSLAVFEDESHASLHSKRIKEGLSLFGIFNTARTPLGRSLLRRWFLQPLQDLEAIANRHDAVEAFLMSDNQPFTGDLAHSLCSMKNVNKVLNKLRQSTAKLADWKALTRFTYQAITARAAVAGMVYIGNVKLLHQALANIGEDILQITGDAINNIIDWDDSANERRICVKAGVDQQLDELKRTYSGLESLLNNIADKIRQQVPTDHARSVQIIYFPQLGYHICVPKKQEWQDEDDFSVESWEFKFASTDHVYYKSAEMHDVDRHLGDLQGLIADKEVEIVHQLQQFILERSNAILRAGDACAELDCLLCLAQAAHDYNYSRPDMTEENVIKIRQGRHPLQELCVDSFVRNDTFLVGGRGCTSADPPVSRADESTLRSDVNEVESGTEEQLHRHTGNSVFIVTGANFCGKSVYLKQVALMVLMAHIGSFVPAEYALIGRTDKIFTRVQTRESVSKLGSAFMIDLGQVSHALRNCTSRSLILLDEFGKGTAASDGAGLLVGTIKHLLARGGDCPKTLIATHFHEIFSSSILPSSLPIDFAHMEIFVDMAMSDVASEDPSRAQITYLHKLATGLSSSSHAAQCALRFGMPLHVVERAEQVTDLVSRHELDLLRLQQEALDGTQRSELEDAEEVCRRFVEWDLPAPEEEWKGEEGSGRERLAAVLGFEQLPATDDEGLAHSVSGSSRLESQKN